jgi:hypothetical protein
MEPKHHRQKNKQSKYSYREWNIKKTDVEEETYEELLEKIGDRKVPPELTNERHGLHLQLKLFRLGGYTNINLNNIEFSHESGLMLQIMGYYCIYLFFN